MTISFEENDTTSTWRRWVNIDSYMSLLIVCAVPLCAFIGYLWNADPLFQNFWGSLVAVVATMFYTLSCIITSIWGTTYHYRDVVTASNILGMTMAIMVTPACIMVFGCVRVA